MTDHSEKLQTIWKIKKNEKKEKQSTGSLLKNYSSFDIFFFSHSYKHSILKYTIYSFKILFSNNLHDKYVLYYYKILMNRTFNKGIIFHHLQTLTILHFSHYQIFQLFLMFRYSNALKTNCKYFFLCLALFVQIVFQVWKIIGSNGVRVYMQVRHSQEIFPKILGILIDIKPYDIIFNPQKYFIT